MSEAKLTNILLLDSIPIVHKLAKDLNNKKRDL